ncbi:serine protease snake-like isoform X2 [Planococcus citri]|uniref:serine protease snake-like isoform X2 n=1 Tax=Planococcus citri TaxID=170843 RepID=UPI0031F86995
MSKTLPRFRDDCRRDGLVCVPHSDCFNTKELIKNRTAIPCGFRDEILQKDVKICCNPSYTPNGPTNSSTTSQKISELSTTSATPKHTPNPKNSTAVALQKCQEYAKYQYETEWIESQLPGEEGHNVTIRDCPSTSLLLPVGIEPPRAKEYPHMALIGYGKEFKNVSWNCEGTLISEKYIMSAAHCSATSVLGQPRWALLGDFILPMWNDDAKPKAYSIVKVHNHPNFKFPSFNYDISLFELNDTVAFNPFVRPACLYTSQADLLINRIVYVTGWEKKNRGEETTGGLLKSAVAIADHQKCRTAFKVGNSTGYDSNTMICADIVENLGRNTCECLLILIRVSQEVQYKSISQMKLVHGIS